MGGFVTIVLIGIPYFYKDPYIECVSVPKYFELTLVPTSMFFLTRWKMSLMRVSKSAGARGITRKPGGNPG